MSKRDNSRGYPPARLRAAYGALEAQLAALLVRARASQWLGLEGDWAAFMSEVEARRVFEEEVLLPAFRTHDPDRRALVDRLIQEHAAMSQLLAAVGGQIGRQSIREATLDILTEVLHEHAAIESANIDPWLDLDPREWSLALGHVPT